MNFNFKYLVVSISFFLVMPSHADISEQRKQIIESNDQPQNSSNFYDRRSEGWYWYDYPQEERKRKLEELKKQQVIIQQQQQQQQQQVATTSPQVQAQNSIVVQTEQPSPKPMSVQWLKEKMPELLQNAIDTPTDERGQPSKQVRAYMYAQRITLDKAQNFATAAATASQLDPFLDENSRVPIDNAANKMFGMENTKNQQKVVDYLTKRVGLWFIYDSTCNFCKVQYDYLTDFKKLNDFKIMNISTDGKRLSNMPPNEVVYPDRGQAKTLKLRITPAIVMVVPPNNYYIVTQGLMSTSALLSRVLLVADKYNVLPKEQKDLLDPYAKGVLTPEQMKKMENLQKELNDDPTKIVDVINKVAGY